jgi:2-polyprenyl-3-methyl-5-hydroxy-6-metoxy-1,4-benzoquinol methylase
MVYKFHSDKKRYFQLQSNTSKNYILPFIGSKTWENEFVLEVGCAEGAVLSSFLEAGAQGLGIELNPHRVNLAQNFLENYIEKGQVEVIAKNIYDFDFEDVLDTKPSLIVLKDVIEHIPNQEKLVPRLMNMLAPGGRIFFAFPPWQMPFGGHQQVCDNKLLSVLPYFHLLPRNVYKWILKAAGENPRKVNELIELKETGISIERFEKIVNQNGLSILKKKAFLFNPVYEEKFGLKPRTQFKAIQNIPYLRNYLTTAMYYLIGH